MTAMLANNTDQTAELQALHSGAGNGSSIIFNMTGNGWSTANSWTNTPLGNTTIGGVSHPTVWQATPNLSTAAFYGCTFETGGVMLDTPTMGPLFRDCYWEGD